MKIAMKHIDNGWYAIAPSVAGKLAKASPHGRLPKHGYEIKVEYEGKKYWLARTTTWGKTVWSLRLVEPIPYGPFPLKIARSVFDR